MNDLNVVVKNGVNLFSSRLIAEATGKEHSNVVRDIKNMLESLGLYDFHPSNLKDDDFKGFFINFKDYQGRKVVDEILLDKQLTMCLVTGYDVKQRMRVIKRVDELEERIKQLAAPQQQTQLIPGTPEHFLDFITQGVTQALTQAYREYFGEPVQNALPAQQQHTEPVAIAAPQREHFPVPRDMITISEVREKYFNNKDVLMQLIVSFGVRSELHHYGYTPDLSAPMNDGLIYDRRQLLAILAALRATSYFIKHGGKFLANPALPDARFTFKRVPTLRDGITADDITSAVEVLLLMQCSYNKATTC